MKFGFRKLSARSFTLIFTILAFSWLLTWYPVHSKSFTQQASQQKLDRVKVSFYTTDDDKDHDTVVWVSLYQPGEKSPVASAQISSEYFRDRTERSLELKLHLHTTRGDISKGTSTIRIEPVGNDSWRFNYTIELYFGDDKDIIKRYYNGLTLDEKTKEISLQLN
ncbi:MAG: hypothetical protein MOB07_03695 [Acidobacteria bacterium]|nr:hypothetical protein [Acidobacteriota bacterium]